MPDHSIDAVADVDVSTAERPQRRARRTRRTDWRLGGRTVLRWRESLLAIALVAVGAGILAAAGVRGLGLGGTIPALIIWGAMIVPVVIALARSRPIGLLRFRAVDVLWGIGLGVLVRLVQGWAEGANAAFPRLATVNGAPAAGWWFTDLIAPVLVAPIVETFFFQGVLLVALYTVLRRPVGGFTAGFAAVLVTTALFVFAHAVTGATAVSDVVALSALGLVAGVLVLLTGRIWGAVLVHLVFNATGAAILVIGTFLA